MMRRIDMVRDKDLTALYPGAWSAVVTLETHEGGSYSMQVDHPKGDPDNPMSEGEVIEKFLSMAEGLPQDQAGWLVDQAMAIEEMDDLSLLLSPFLREEVEAP